MRGERSHRRRGRSLIAGVLGIASCLAFGLGSAAAAAAGAEAGPAASSLTAGSANEAAGVAVGADPGADSRASAAALVLVGRPASADGPRIELSRTGEDWGDDLDDPLFDPAIRWVPGDRRAAGIFVRNRGESAAWVSIRAQRVAERGDMPSDWLVFEARVDDGPWLRLPDHRSTADLVRVEPGVEQPPRRVEVRANLLPEAGNEVQRGAVALAFSLEMREAVGSGDGSGDGSSDDATSRGDGGQGSQGSPGERDGHGVLAVTGARLWAGWWIAAVAAGVGAAFAVGAARDRCRGAAQEPRGETW